MAVRYEWDVEVCDLPAQSGDDVDIIDHLHQTDYAGVVAELAIPAEPGQFKRAVLVRDDDRRNGCRSWAYMEGGQLPAEFLDAYDRPVACVPGRFLAEVAKGK